MSGDYSDLGTPWDDDDDSVDYPHDESLLDSLDVYIPAASDDVVESDTLWSSQESAGSSTESIDTLIVTAANPAATVVVKVLMDGRVVEVKLAPNVVQMTESELAKEISTITNLAQRQAKAGQHAFIAAFMHDRGHDQVATRAFLERTVGLPSPQTVLDEKARLFASRYSDDD